MYEIVDNAGEGTFFKSPDVAWYKFAAAPVGYRLVKYSQPFERISDEWEMAEDCIMVLQGDVVDPDV